MSNLDYLLFLKKSLNIVSVNLVGINVIVMKEKYRPQKVMLQPYIDQDGDMNGTIWIEPKDDNHKIIVRIKKPVDEGKFTIKSDLAGSLYMYYYAGIDDSPCTLHAQSVLRR